MISEETRKLIEENEELVEKNLRRWIAGCKKRMTAFTIPTDEEIIQYFNDKGKVCTSQTREENKDHVRGQGGGEVDRF